MTYKNETSIKCTLDMVYKRINSEGDITFSNSEATQILKYMRLLNKIVEDGDISIGGNQTDISIGGNQNESPK